MDIPGFTSIEALHAAVRQCRNCPLHQTRTNAVPGEGPHATPVMIVGEAPGKENDRLGRPFVGRGGQILNSILKDAGLRRESCYLTNTIRCRPPENRTPTTLEIIACRTYLDSEIALLGVKLIIALGSVASKLILNDATLKLTDAHGKLVKLNDSAFVCPTYHPNGLRYIKGGRAAMVADIRNALQTLGISFPMQDHDGSPMQERLPF